MEPGRRPHRRMVQTPFYFGLFYLVGCTACQLLLGFRTAAIPIWMAEFGLDVGSFGWLPTSWFLGKLLGLVPLRFNLFGRWTVPAYMGVVTLASFTASVTNDAGWLFVMYGFEGFGNVVFGWWAPVLLRRNDPVHFERWTAAFSAINLLAVGVGAALFGVLEPVIGWREILRLRACVMGCAAILCGVTERHHPHTQTCPGESDVQPSRGLDAFAILTILAILPSICILESFSYWGIVYIENTFDIDFEPRYQVYFGTAILLSGGVAVVIHGFVFRTIQHTLRNHQLSIQFTTLIACIVCVYLGLFPSIRTLVPGIIVMLVPALCVVLASSYFLAATTALPVDQRNFTTALEASNLTISQWIAPLGFAFLISHFDYLFFFIYGGLFLVSSIATRILSQWSASDPKGVEDRVSTLLPKHDPKDDPPRSPSNAPEDRSYPALIELEP